MNIKTMGKYTTVAVTFKDIKSSRWERNPECTTCGKIFTSFTYYPTRERTHTREKHYKYKKCSKSFSFSSFQVHERTHHGEKPNTFQRNPYLREILCKERGKGFIITQSF